MISHAYCWLKFVMREFYYVINIVRMVADVMLMYLTRISCGAHVL